MIYELVVPYFDRLGDEGVIAQWCQREDSDVGYGDDLFELRITPKLGFQEYIVRVTSSDAGVLRKVVAPEGQHVRVGDRVALLSTDRIESLEAGKPFDGLFRVVCNRG